MRKILISEVEEFLILASNRGEGELPENIYPEGKFTPPGGEAAGKISMVVALRAEQAGANILASVLMSGFCLGREFEVRARELQGLAGLEAMFSLPAEVTPSGLAPSEDPDPGIEDA